MLSKEEILIKEYKETLNTNDDISFTGKELSKLLKAYKRSHKQLNKIIKISDKQQDELKEIQKRLNKTILFVTHDIGEALKLGTKIILLNEGQIEQMGSSEELIFNPASGFVREFLGLKGFKASLNEAMMERIYDKILNKEMDKNKIYQQIEEVS